MCVSPTSNFSQSFQGPYSLFLTRWKDKKLFLSTAIPSLAHLENASTSSNPLICAQTIYHFDVLFTALPMGRKPAKEEDWKERVWKCNKEGELFYLFSLVFCPTLCANPHETLTPIEQTRLLCPVSWHCGLMGWLLRGFVSSLQNTRSKPCPAFLNWVALIDR